MSDLSFEVTAQSESPARVRVAVRQFTVIVDEPPELGGEDRGPNPVETVLAGLAGCLNVVAHMVAREHGLRISDLSIRARGELNPQRLFNQPTADRPGFKRIEATLSFRSDATPEQLRRWLAEVESRCPVSDNLGNATPLELKFAAQR